MELKPCPFCGDYSLTVSIGCNEQRYDSIYCNNCNVLMRVEKEYVRRNNAWVQTNHSSIKRKWNKRAKENKKETVD